MLLEHGMALQANILVVVQSMVFMTNIVLKGRRVGVIQVIELLVCREANPQPVISDLVLARTTP